MKQIVCMKWGSLYGPEYVNRLYGMVERNITGPFRFVCLTDRAEGIREEIECLDCPEISLPPPHNNRGWRKLTLWAETVADLKGNVLFLDLDVVITANIDCFFEYRPEEDYCVMRNPTQLRRRIGNTSVFRFRVGSHPELLANLENNPHEILARYSNSQTYVSETIRRMTFWPDPWCRLFKVHCVPRGMRRWFIEPGLPEGTRIVAFPGSPNPHEAASGRWPAPWYKKFYKHIRPAGWVRQHWQ